MKRHDQTQPMPAPEGMKWVVYKSMLGYEDSTAQLYEIGLVPQGALFALSDRGYVKPGQAYPLVSADFAHPHAIRRASKRVLRRYHAQQAEDSTFAALRKEFS